MKSLYTLRSTDGKILQVTPDSVKELGSFTGKELPRVGELAANTWFKFRGDLWCAARLPSAVVVGKFEQDNLTPVSSVPMTFVDDSCVFSNVVAYGGQMVWIGLDAQKFNLYSFDGTTLSARPVAIPDNACEVLTLSTFGGRLALLPSSLSVTAADERAQACIRSWIYLIDFAGTDLLVSQLPCVPGLSADSDALATLIPQSAATAESDIQNSIISAGVFKDSFVGITASGKLYSSATNLLTDRKFLADLRLPLSSTRSATTEDGSLTAQIIVEDRLLGDMIPLLLGTRVTIGSGEHAGIHGTVVDVRGSGTLHLTISSGSTQPFPLIVKSTDVSFVRGLSGGFSTARHPCEPGPLVKTAFHEIGDSLYGFVFGRQILPWLKTNSFAQPSFVFRLDADNKVKQALLTIDSLPLNAWNVQTIRDSADNSIHILYYDSATKSVRHLQYNVASEALMDLGDLYASEERACLTSGSSIIFEAGELDIVLGDISANVSAGTVTLAYETFSNETDFHIEFFYCTDTVWKPATPSPTQVAGSFTHLLRVDEPTFNGDIQYKVNIRRI
jgi:hypothetical protein